MRANCIYKLRHEFGNLFIGGLAPSVDALKNYPDCVVDRKIITKKSYLKLLKNSTICIATEGLFGSNGWKLGEYIAGAKAIVTEKLRHEVPGEFKKGVNYLEFSSPDQCLECVQTLINNPKMRYQMMKENYSYYNNFLRPDILILNSINTCLQKYTD